jgi:hypothetical protein
MHSSFHRRKLMAKDVRDILVRFLDGTGTPEEFDTFVSVPIEDPRLDAISKRCDGLPSEFPPKVAGHYCDEGGVEVIRQYIRELRDNRV